MPDTPVTFDWLYSDDKFGQLAKSNRPLDKYRDIDGTFIPADSPLVTQPMSRMSDAYKTGIILTHMLQHVHHQYPDTLRGKSALLIMEHMIDAQYQQLVPKSTTHDIPPVDESAQVEVHIKSQRQIAHEL